MIRTLLIFVLLTSQASAALPSLGLGRRGNFNSWRSAPPQRTFEYQRGSVTGHVGELPQEPTYYTVVVLPEDYERSQASQQLLAALATDPTLVAVRRATCLQCYSVADPDFRHRFQPQDTLPTVLAGKTAMMIVDRSGGLVWWLQGGSARQYAADIAAKGVLDEITNRGGGLLGRIRRPNVCTPKTCRPNQPNAPNQPTTTDTGEPLRPIPPPIADEDQPAPAAPEDQPPVADDAPQPTVPPELDLAVADQAEAIKQLQATINELRQQIVINTPASPQAPPFDYEKIIAAMKDANKTDPQLVAALEALLDKLSQQQQPNAPPAQPDQPATKRYYWQMVRIK